MNLVGVLVVLAVIGVVAAVVTGAVRGDMAEPTTSLAPSGLPDGELTPQDVRDVRFSLGFRGYRMDEVDEVLERLTAELVSRDAELASRNVQLAELLRRTGEGDLAGPGQRPAGQQPSAEGTAARSATGERAPLPGTEPGPAHAAAPAADDSSQGGYDRSAAERVPGDRTTGDRTAGDRTAGDRTTDVQPDEPRATDANANGQGGNGVGQAPGRHVAEAAADQRGSSTHPGRHEAPVDPRSPATEVGQPVPGGARRSDAEAR